MSHPSHEKRHRLYRLPENHPVLDTDPVFHEFATLIRARYSSSEQQHIFRASNFMYELHHDQKKYDAQNEYYRHPLMVATRVVRLLDTPRVEPVVAALLHDGPEDQTDRLAALWPHAPHEDQCTQALAALEMLFGQRVRQIVHGLTNPDFNAELAEHNIDRSHPQYAQAKNQLYAEHVAKAIQDPDVALVKFCDFIGNIGNIETVADPARQAHLRAKYTPVIQIFVDRFLDHRHPVLLNATKRDAVIHQLLEQLPGFKQPPETR